MKKSIRTNFVQFKKLTKKQRRQFLNNLGHGMTTSLLFTDADAIKCKYTKEVLRISEVLMSAFTWSRSPEGHTYWREIKDKHNG